MGKVTFGVLLLFYVCALPLLILLLFIEFEGKAGDIYDEFEEDAD